MAFWGEGRPLEHSEFRLASAFGFGGLTRASQEEAARVSHARSFLRVMTHVVCVVSVAGHGASRESLGSRSVKKPGRAVTKLEVCVAFWAFFGVGARLAKASQALQGMQG